MASKESAQTAQVLLVGSRTLPVLLHSNSEENGNNISVDLLQQALRGAAAMEDSVGSSAEEGVAIYQGEEGRSHTIKISLAEAESLGLHFSNDTFPMSLENDTIEDSLKIGADSSELITHDLSSSDSVSINSILHSMACASIPPEGTMIDDSGNLVQATEGLQILPSSLSALLEGGMNQSITIIPQYGLDGNITYAVKLKDPAGNVLGPDYRIMEPDTSAKTGLDIEEELTHTNMKQNILNSSENVSLPAASLDQGSHPPIASLSLPVTLDSLPKHMFLPMSSSTVPISMQTPVTLSLSTESSVGTGTVSSINVTQPSNLNRCIRILPDRSTLAVSNIMSSGASSFPLNNMVPQGTLSSSQQCSILGPAQAGQILPSKIATLSGSSVINIESRGSNKALNNPKTASPTKLRATVSGTRLHTSQLPTTRKMPVSIATPATTILSPAPAPEMAAVAPNTSQPTIGAALTSKSLSTPNRTTSTSANSLKPLGSSENPIQLVQQGQTFHSMQALSQAQLRQIATVLQQKHLNPNPTTAKNVLFDEQTKTRIVYRVVYPEDVDLQQPTSPVERNANNSNEAGRSASIKVRGRRGRRREISEGRLEKAVPRVLLPTQNSLVLDPKNFDEDQTTEVTKVERKKILGSRTRYGRVSRPPKHMMKDYKRLHPLDFHEPDADDSDGGYSDYNNAEPIPDIPCEKEPDPEIDISSIDGPPIKKKISRFSCPTCKKLYLGHGRMEKHFNRFPDHGSIEEFKKSLSVANPPDKVDAEKGKKSSVSKSSNVRGKKRGQCHRSENERSENRKKKLKQALQACELSEILEVVGPLIAQYFSLWKFLLLRILVRDSSNINEEGIENTNQTLVKDQENSVDNLTLNNKANANPASETICDNSQSQRAEANRVQWLLMELSSLADALQSIAQDLLEPADVHENGSNKVEIYEKTVSEILGVSCGTYTANEEPLVKHLESLTAGKFELKDDEMLVCAAKRMRMKAEEMDDSLSTSANVTSLCPEVLPSLSMVVKPSVSNDADKAILAKLSEDMPFLNSSDDMICDGEDADLSTDSKRDGGCDRASGLQVVDDIVNERLKNLGENVNYSVQLPRDLRVSTMSDEQTDLHLLGDFGGAESSISVRNQSVISSSLGDNKASVSVPSIDLINSYSMSALSPSVSISQDANISNPGPPPDLANALEPVASQGILGAFPLGLSSLGPYDSLQSQPSPMANVSHSTDSFLDSLSSFENPLSQSCTSSEAPVSAYGDTVTKAESILQLNPATSESVRPPPKFISSFTPANDKQSVPITTAQRLQRSYLELDSGLDVGLDTDLDFEAFT